MVVCSYSYDVTHTLQFNMTAYNLQTAATSAVSAESSSAKCEFWQTDVDDDPVVHDSACADRDVEDASCVLQADLLTDDVAVTTAGDKTSTDNSGESRPKHGRFQHSSANTESKML